MSFDHGTKLNGIFVYVVDDDPAVRMVLEGVLVEAGCEVKVFEDGHDAVRQCPHDKPDVVLLDLRMPRLDGFGVLDELASSDSPPSIYVITGDTHPDTVSRVLDKKRKDRADASMVKGFIAKPFQSHEEIIRRIAAGARFQSSTHTPLQSRTAGASGEIEQGPPPTSQGPSESADDFASALDHVVAFVVDDDPGVRFALQDLLEDAGCRVHVFGDGRSAALAVRLHKPQIILLGLNMPGMLGHDLIDMLSKEKEDLAVYVITADSNHKTARGVFGRARDEARRRSVVRGFISKPLEDGQDIVTKIARDLFMSRRAKKTKDALAQVIRVKEPCDDSKP